MKKIKKNISIFIENYVAGGSDKIARDLIDNLEYEKCYLFVNSRNDFSMLLSKPLPKNCELIKYGIKTIPELGLFANSLKNKNLIIYFFLKVFNLIIRYPLLVVYIFYFYSLLRKYPIDIFFSNNGGYPGGECNRVATLVSSILKIKNYHIVHNLATFPFFKPYKYIEYFIDWILSKKTTFICVSNQTKDYLLDKRNIRCTPLVITNGVQKIYNNIKTFNKDYTTIKLLNIGALGERKNQLMLIESINILKSNGYENITLYLVGKEEDEGYLKFLKSKIEEYKLQDKVFFEGFQNNPYKYYDICDIFILSSKVESFALVRVEAMSVGMPIITTDVGDANLQVINNENGYIVYDFNEMVDCIEKYIKDSSLIKSHSIRGFEIYNNFFTIENMIKKYQDLIEGDIN
ncbi:glycosyltransferase [Aliarcobacter butzleri]|uniref:glycosyltransferase n=1 Tax=Aliarcobacter butzleri TaxID=28197 RepID=UPI001EDADE29|nr:glycosyltransferase [Aliarcobacter butzleri]MCG3658929.1 glycosyltransferase [Aliarcobacter butzleri]MCG3701767.1 glycosyltransferase [Aliarcobacter butzleri]MCG3703948.1 glycosyltransferase [Aliarcobacter butzleri]